MLSGSDADMAPLPYPATPAEHIDLPLGAWDCHAHVIGSPHKFPFVEDRIYTPLSFAVDEYLRVLDVAGVQFGILVQISVHGTDNRALLEALKASPDRLVGIAVIDRAATELEMAALVETGVKGIRLLDMAGGVGTHDLEYFASRCAEIGWHIELCAPAARLRELEPRLNQLSLPVVLDHCGKFDPEKGPDHEDFSALLRLLRRDNIWMKLAGYYRLSGDPLRYSDVLPFLTQFLATAPDRLVWGSDWPNVCCPTRQLPHYGKLLDCLGDITTQAQRRAIFSNNPVQLYRRT